ncbi:MAG: hypothetical protein WC708_11480 [Lentisphaeria bacterium]
MESFSDPARPAPAGASANWQQEEGTINLTDYDALKKKLLEKFVSN